MMANKPCTSNKFCALKNYFHKSQNSRKSSLISKNEKMMGSELTYVAEGA